MTQHTRQLHLNVNVLGIGTSPAAWQRASGNALGALDPGHFARVARIAERGHLDGFFLADSLAPPFPPELGIVWGLDPLLLLSSVAVVTERIGLIASVTTTFNEPYNVARSMASLDHLSHGRASWNVVTSYDQPGARKFGLAELPDRDQRYRRAAEFVDVVRALWDSWGPKTIVLDRDRNVFADSRLIRPVDHHGEFFDVSGVLQLPSPPQGHPVLFQAGASDAGLDLAARYADGVFSAQHTLRGAQQSYSDLKRRVAAYGRDPGDIKIMPGLSLVVGASDEEAERKVRETRELTGENATVKRFLGALGVDLAPSDYDRPVPSQIREVFAKGFHNRGFDKATLDLLDERPHITPRELANSGGNVHRILVGGPEKVADDIEQWFEAGAADGFVLMFDVLPAGLEAFVDHVVPLLVRKGIFRSEYTGATLRHHLGLKEVLSAQTRSRRSASRVPTGVPTVA
jgi:FMN-dependent oxidoreductase (nitrilotriacetate monooxygenase family)